MDIITRKQARQIGQKTYFTGKSCSNQHVAARYVSTGGCVECLMHSQARNGSMWGATHRKAHREKHVEQNRAWRQRNPTSVKQSRERTYNPKYYVDRYQRLKSEIQVKHKLYRTLNRALYTSLSAKRRTVMTRATPLWYEADAVQDMYQKAVFLTEQTGVAYEVDHIVPLQSKYVCGLHCLANLQVIPASENRRKSNKLLEG